MALILELSHYLSHNLSIGLTSESDITEVFVFNLWVIIDYSIVHDKYFFILVVVRMTVFFTDLPTSCPSGMSDSDCWADGLFGEFIDKSLNAI